MEMNKSHFFAALVVLVGISTVESQDLTKCADILLESSYIPTCENVRDYFICVIKELQGDNFRAGYGSTRDFLEEHLQDALIHMGLQCYIDFDELFEQIRSEEEPEYSVVSTASAGPQNDFDDVCGYYKPCNHICTNTGGGYYRCSCFPGYRPNPQFPDHCIDIDECVENRHQCQGRCINTEGSYTCECQQGYTLANDGTSCVPIASAHHGCVYNRPYGCDGVPDGDYAVCGPECQRGVYISCSGYAVHRRWCSTGWYQQPSGHHFEERLVYDPYLRRCIRSSRSCPRTLDNYLVSVHDESEDSD